MAEAKIMTLHPEGKQGVNILKRRYDHMKDTIIEILQEHGEVSFKDLGNLAKERLAGTFDGKILWYLTTVKLDLEARGVIKRLPVKSPQHLVLIH